MIFLLLSIAQQVFTAELGSEQMKLITGQKPSNGYGFNIDSEGVFGRLGAEPFMSWGNAFDDNELYVFYAGSAISAQARVKPKSLIVHITANKHEKNTAWSGSFDELILSSPLQQYLKENLVGVPKTSADDID